MSRFFNLTRAGLALMSVMLMLSVQAKQPEAGGQPQLNLPRTQLFANMYRIDAQVAATDQTRQTGLMHRQQMPQHEGMLFVFERPGVQCFWMKNTRIPLSAAFIAEDGRIVNIADMQPMKEDAHCSKAPVRYVLEMNQGWFKQRGIGEGFVLKGQVFESAQAAQK